MDDKVILIDDGEKPPQRADNAAMILGLLAAGALPGPGRVMGSGRLVGPRKAARGRTTGEINGADRLAAKYAHADKIRWHDANGKRQTGRLVKHNAKTILVLFGGRVIKIKRGRVVT